MKKTIVSLAVTAMMASGVMANDAVKGMSSVQFGAHKATHSNGDTLDTNLYIGFDLMMPLAFHENLYIGIGGDLLGLEGVIKNNGSYTDSYTMGGNIKIGYSLQKLVGWNINLKAEGGYGVTRLIDENYWGSQYSAGIDVGLYKSLAVGYKYKFVNVKSAIIPDYTSNIVYLQIAL
jgi:hypothetical protein